MAEQRKRYRELPIGFTPKRLAFAGHGDAAFALTGADGWVFVKELSPPRAGKYVWTTPDLAGNRMQVCYGGGAQGATLSWVSSDVDADLAAGLAHGVKATYWTTSREVFDATVERMRKAFAPLGEDV